MSVSPLLMARASRPFLSTAGMLSAAPCIEGVRYRKCETPAAIMRSSPRCVVQGRGEDEENAERKLVRYRSGLF